MAMQDARQSQLGGLKPQSATESPIASRMNGLQQARHVAILTFQGRRMSIPWLWCMSLLSLALLTPQTTNAPRQTCAADHPSRCE